MNAASVVVSCEHASAEVPEPLGDLGLGPDVLASHVAWDPGARPLALAVAEALDAPVRLGRFTRLVADLNRGPDNPEAVPELAFGVAIPANRALGPAARAERIARYHAPYWEEVTGLVAGRLAAGPVLHLSVHSFDPSFGAAPRPWDVGVLFDPDRRFEADLATRIAVELGAAGLDAAPNVPYDGRSDYLVTRLRRLGDGYAGIMVEMSQRHVGATDRIARSLVGAVRAAVGVGR